MIIYMLVIIINEAERDQNNLLENVIEFNNKYRSKTKECKEETLLIV